MLSWEIKSYSSRKTASFSLLIFGIFSSVAAIYFTRICSTRYYTSTHARWAGSFNLKTSKRWWIGTLKFALCTKQQPSHCIHLPSPSLYAGTCFARIRSFHRRDCKICSLLAWELRLLVGQNFEDLFCAKRALLAFHTFCISSFIRSHTLCPRMVQ